MSLHVGSFGGGAVLLGAADTRRVDELLAADGYDLGGRGALVSGADPVDYLTIGGSVLHPGAVSAVHALLTTAGINYARTLAVVEGLSPAGIPAYLIASFPRDGAGTLVLATNPGPLTGPAAGGTSGAVLTAIGDGVLVTSAVTQGTIPFTTAPVVPPLAPATDVQVFLVNVGAREGTAPRLAPGLHVIVCFARSPAVFSVYPIQRFDALGTGPFGTLATGIPGDPDPPAYGTKSQQLYFRGIVGFNGYVFGWGFDSADTANGDGPCRVMFSNLGKPTTWGNDNQAVAPATTASGDRLFTDSDAITFGSAGENIRAGIVVFGKLFFGTNRGLHFLQGNGRATFVTNGTIPVMNAHNVLGPNALIEGPDRRLYGVGDRGLWRYDGAGVPEPLFEKLVDFDGRSPGWWDLLWTDAARSPGVPGRTNGDLVWTAVDQTRQQVLIGIPWCNATTGRGVGQDTVVVKYHVRTGGFTRQVFRNVQYTCAGFFRRDALAGETRFVGTGTRGVASVRRFAEGTRPPVDPPVVHFGPYDPFGPDGQGVVRRAYLTLAWAAASALPLAWRVTTTVDDSPVDAFALTVGPTVPSAPSAGDVWLDTSASDGAIGNAVGTGRLRATGGHLAKTYTDAFGWALVPGQGGAGTRATVPLPLTPRPGTRIALRLELEAASGRYELEGLGLGLGLNAGAGVPNA